MIEIEQLYNSRSKFDRDVVSSQLKSLVTTYLGLKDQIGDWQKDAMERSIVSFSVDLIDQGLTDDTLHILQKLNPDLKPKDEQGKENPILRDLVGEVHALTRLRREIVTADESHNKLYTRVRDKFNIFFQNSGQFKLL